ncbi:MAG: hypothetical protein FWG31_02155 [Oscillospiraceae bacterium]|nr:hypothetical protein [Oscillospiraceae bacterium]
MFILGIAIFLAGGALFIIWNGGEIGLFLDPPMLFLILVSLLTVLTATRSYRVFWGGLKAVIRPKESLSEDLRGQAASLFRLLSKTTAIASGIGVIICAAITFSNVETPQMLRHALATILTMPLYGLFLIVVMFESIVFSLKKRRNTEHR